MPPDPATTTRSGPSLVVAVVPALNEAHAIAGVVKGASEYVDHVIVVDDGSGDDTRTLAEEAGAVVIHHPRRLGVGAAVASGLARAQELGATAVVQVDGDGQHEPRASPTCSPPSPPASTSWSAPDSSTASRWAGCAAPSSACSPA
jgi:glycosyltransferase involved in cell wall biosynthesis